MQANGGGGGSACASCKHQRKRCADDCKLAPYFPAGMAREFQAVQKLFGVSNVTKLLDTLELHDRPSAVKSLIWEADARQRNPILGPYADWLRLHEDNGRLEAEVFLLKGEIMRLRNIVYLCGSESRGKENNDRNQHDQQQQSVVHGNGNVHIGLPPATPLPSATRDMVDYRNTNGSSVPQTSRTSFPENFLHYNGRLVMEQNQIEFVQNQCHPQFVQEPLEVSKQISHHSNGLTHPPMNSKPNGV